MALEARAGGQVLAFDEGDAREFLVALDPALLVQFQALGTIEQGAYVLFEPVARDRLHDGFRL
ncbi:hypothetical protein OUY22_25955 [Nonomuraea sp. MCN248]|uniref:Uncharacterized protein n=1 Tax=Nonomuraea corallina TaxID=2989783 RepID=A0ABT4SI40_9ACTN|nr:hypothetical protein [Nonomuraea corallina]MDA0636868.1 hypothetical protein [Nonomuraea corallina]